MERVFYFFFFYSPRQTRASKKHLRIRSADENSSAFRGKGLESRNRLLEHGRPRAVPRTGYTLARTKTPLRPLRLSRPIPSRVGVCARIFQFKKHRLVVLLRPQRDVFTPYGAL